MITNIIYPLLSVTQEAAIAAYEEIGKGDETKADRVAVDAMRRAFNQLHISGRIVIGEGERDKAPMLFSGEKIGKGGEEYDIAVDPLEGTTILAKGQAGSLSVLAIAEKGGILKAPDVYMNKIAIGFNYKEQIIDLSLSIKENLTNIALAKNTSISNLVVTILDRKRHEELIAKTRECGVRIKLISDGDVAAVIGTTSGQADAYIGIGGAPEGVLACAALKATAGQFCGKLLFASDLEKVRATSEGIIDLEKQYYLDDIITKDSVFLASGITDGAILDGIRKTADSVVVNSLLMISNTKTVHKIFSTIL